MDNRGFGTSSGIILYKSYVKDINPMGMSYIEHTSSHYVEMNQYGRSLFDEEWQADFG